VGEAWFVARAEALGLTPEAARARDAAFSETAPPETPPDARLAAHAAALWTTLCASCHGVTGRLEGVPATPPEAPRPRELGTTGMAMGFFFGGDKMRAGLYRKIAHGQPPSEKPSPMPTWAGTLAREQIWALVAHIESL
jgi:mono/diheme cytochrome c family protein